MKVQQSSLAALKVPQKACRFDSGPYLAPLKVPDCLLGPVMVETRALLTNLAQTTDEKTVFQTRKVPKMVLVRAYLIELVELTVVVSEKLSQKDSY